MTTENNDWLDFKAIKATIEVKPILQHFDILPYLSENGTELIGWCPLGNEHGKQDSFSFNIEKKSFQCFSCKARGSLLDFIAKYQNISLREAAKMAMAICGGEENKISNPNKHRQYNKQPLVKNSLPIYSWDQALALVKNETLAANQLVVLDIADLKTFLKNSVANNEKS